MNSGGEVVEPGGLTLRPGAVSRYAGWAMIVFGLLFGSAGFAGPDDQAALVLMLIFGALMASLGAALVTARATVDRSGIRYRYGLIKRNIPAADVSAVEVVPGSGQGARLAVGVRRKSGRVVRLTAMQRYDTPKGLETVRRTADRMLEVLDLDSRGN